MDELKSNYCKFIDKEIVIYEKEFIFRERRDTIAIVKDVVFKNGNGVIIAECDKYLKNWRTNNWVEMIFFLKLNDYGNKWYLH